MTREVSVPARCSRAALSPRERRCPRKTKIAGGIYFHRERGGGVKKEDVEKTWTGPRRTEENEPRATGFIAERTFLVHAKSVLFFNASKP